MRILGAWRKGWSFVYSKLQLVGLLYLVNVLFALIIVVPLSNYLDDRVGDSMSMMMDRFVGFDYSFLSDFINNYGMGIDAILEMSKLVKVLYLLISVFLMGGILHSIKHSERKYDFNLFVVGGLKYYWRLMILTIVFIIIHLLVFSLCFFVFQSAIGGLSPFGIESDTKVILAGKIMIAVYLFIALIIKLWHEYSKLSMISDEKNLLFNLKQGIIQLRRNFISGFTFLISTALMLVLIFVLNHLIKSGFGIEKSILIVFLLSQLVLIFRFILKLIFIRGLYHLSSFDITSKELDPQIS